MKVSVIICTHDPNIENLQRAIAAICSQSLPPDCWELLIIDNASQAKLEDVVTLRSDRNARIIREDRLGLTPARLRGIAESQTELLVFVDDDNFLSPDYLEQALNIAQDYSFLGAWSGQCIPEFDSPPPEWTRIYWGALAIREIRKDVWSNVPRYPVTMPCGAGLCVRRAVAQSYWDRHKHETIILDRMGQSLISGGDNDLATTACEIGLGIGLFSGLKLTHKIPSERLTLGYLCRLIEGIEYSSVILDKRWGIQAPIPTLKSKIARIMRGFFQSYRDRSIAAAADRGRQRARNFLQQIKADA